MFSPGFSLGQRLFLPWLIALLGVTPFQRVPTSSLKDTIALLCAISLVNSRFIVGFGCGLCVTVFDRI